MTEWTELHFIYKLTWNILGEAWEAHKVGCWQRSPHSSVFIEHIEAHCSLHLLCSADEQTVLAGFNETKMDTQLKQTLAKKL